MSHWRPPVPGMLAVLALVVAVIGLAQLDWDPGHSSMASRGCLTGSAAARVNAAFAAAGRRYRREERGSVIHEDLRRIANDSVLVDALSVGDLKQALTQANRQLVKHVVRIRILRGSRVLVDASPSSFDVAGSGMELYDRTGRPLGRLEITVQDVIGFIKLVHKLNFADVVVRGARGHVRSSFPGATRVSLPSSGCKRIGAHRYGVRSFKRTSFSGEPLTIWLLTAA
jgi:hypothetical protein